MTGRDLIIYILANKLEDESVFKDGSFVGYITASEAAEKAGVGVATIYAWVNYGLVNCMIISGKMYIPADFKPPLRNN